MGILKDKINEKINHLKNEFENNRNIKHQGIKGTFNEGEFAELIKEVIPTRYIVTKGIIENSKDEQSNETDIIIYDNDILPYYFKNDLSFVPIEAVKYIFEIKSALDVNELKTTISKFSKYKQIGGKSPTVLFAFSSDIKGNELERYYKNDTNFFINPYISVLCISNKCYCYKTVDECYLKDFYSNEKWLSMCSESLGININEALETIDNSFTNDVLEKMNRKEFTQAIKTMIHIDKHKQKLNDYKLTINGIEFNKIKFKIHTWVQINTSDKSNIELLSFLSGISNTLSKEFFGNYLLNNLNDVSTVCAICYEDMWGNISCQDFNKDGLDYDINKFSFSYQSNGEDNSHKMIFSNRSEQV